MSKLVIVGLGPGTKDYISYRAWSALQESTCLILRTSQHPIAAEMQEAGVDFTTCDHFYEQLASFDTVYDHITQHILEVLRHKDCVHFAVPGHPFVLEKTVKLLLEQTSGDDSIDVEIIPSMSAIEMMYARLALHPTSGVMTLDAMDMPDKTVWSGQALVITQVHNKLVAGDLKLLLLEEYPADHPVTIIKAAGIPELEEIIEMPLYQLDWHEFDHLSSVYVSELVDNLQAMMRRLLDILELLRSPEGCPWDREQTHASLKASLLEECYEVLEALQDDDMDALQEELGDLLLQIVFHCQLAKETYAFSFQDVVRGISDKMVRRHPHVFGSVKVRDTAEVAVNWEAIKATEHPNHNKQTSILDSIPKTLPALMMAEKVQQKAARVGFDWNHISEVWAKVDEEYQELQQAWQQDDPEAVMSEIGDLIFAVVNIARFLKVNSEQALLNTIKKFKNRFSYIEKQVAKEGKEFSSFTLVELDVFWEKAKELERNA